MLGGTLFYALTGRPPYEVEDRDAIAFMKAHARAPIPDAADYNPNVPEEVAQLLRRMMSKRSHERGTAAELLAAFRDLLPSDVTPKRAAAPGRKSRPIPTAAPRPMRPAAPAEPEPRGLLDRVFGPFLSVFERVLLPGRLRPVSGHEPPAGERAAALLRRPVVLLLLLLVSLAGGLIYWAVR